MLILLSVLLFTGKGILSNKHAHFFFFALNIHRVHKQVFVDVLLFQCFEKALFK